MVQKLIHFSFFKSQFAIWTVEFGGTYRGVSMVEVVNCLIIQAGHMRKCDQLKTQLAS